MSVGGGEFVSQFGARKYVTTCYTWTGRGGVGCPWIFLGEEGIFIRVRISGGCRGIIPRDCPGVGEGGLRVRHFGVERYVDRMKWLDCM